MSSEGCQMSDVKEGKESVFLLRLWSDDDQDWQGSLKNIRTREVKYFMSMYSLISHLENDEGILFREEN